jgi:hypothetical protein
MLRALTLASRESERAGVVIGFDSRRSLTRSGQAQGKRSCDGSPTAGVVNRHKKRGSSHGSRGLALSGVLVSGLCNQGVGCR